MWPATYRANLPSLGKPLIRDFRTNTSNQWQGSSEAQAGLTLDPCCIVSPAPKERARERERERERERVGERGAARREASTNKACCPCTAEGAESLPRGLPPADGALFAYKTYLYVVLCSRPSISLASRMVAPSARLSSTPSSARHLLR
jgi:hypothetical protein